MLRFLKCKTSRISVATPSNWTSSVQLPFLPPIIQSNTRPQSWNDLFWPSPRIWNATLDSIVLLGCKIGPTKGSRAEGRSHFLFIFLVFFNPCKRRIASAELATLYNPQLFPLPLFFFTATATKVVVVCFVFVKLCILWCLYCCKKCWKKGKNKTSQIPRVIFFILPWWGEKTCKKSAF